MKIKLLSTSNMDSESFFKLFKLITDEFPLVYDSRSFSFDDDGRLFIVFDVEEPTGSQTNLDVSEVPWKLELKNELDVSEEPSELRLKDGIKLNELILKDDETKLNPKTESLLDKLLAKRLESFTELKKLEDKLLKWD